MQSWRANWVNRFNWLHDFEERKGLLVYQVFDVLYLDDHDLPRLPLLRRKEILRRLFKDSLRIRVSEPVEEHGVAFFRAVADHGLEGMSPRMGRAAIWQASARNPG